MKIVSFFCGLLAAFLALSMMPGRAEPAKTAPRAVSFQIATECNCASCVFDAQRSIKKFEGVKSAKFNGRDRRLEIEFVEGARAISELAFAVEMQELGKGGALLWPVPRGRDGVTLAQNLARVSGVKSAKPDAKSGLILLSFQSKPAVTLAQLDAATQDENHVNR